MAGDKKGLIIPGDKLAVIEEFEAGEGTYVDDGVIRANTLGVVHKNFAERRIEVKRKKTVKIPKAGDIIIGQVESAQAFDISIRIHFLNNEPSQKGFVGMLLLREDENKVGKNKIPCKVGDLVRAKVSANVDMIIILSLLCSNCGVIYAVCSVCGGKLVKMDTRLKCVECGNIEHRLVAPDYGLVKFP
ncbi:MAG: exosome complex RNA-binding protein Csl4 [Nitrososphaerales archaeon]